MSKEIIDGPGEYVRAFRHKCTVVYFCNGYWYGHGTLGEPYRWRPDGTWVGSGLSQSVLRNITGKLVPTHAMAGGEFLEPVGGVA